MNECRDAWEPELSALVDGELSTEETLEALDHVSGCGSCRRFYRQVRQLGTVLPRATAPPPSSWSRIERAAGGGGGVSRWGMSIAALLLLSLGLWSLGVGRPERTATAPPRHFEVTLGGDGGQMTDTRFVELTLELLRSDGRYVRKMREVLQAVEELSDRRESRGWQEATYPEEEAAEEGPATAIRADLAV